MRDDDYKLVSELVSMTVHHECYTYVIPHVGEMLWDVTLAQIAIAHGEWRETTTIPIEEMGNIARANAWTEARVAQVDRTIPGIGAPVTLVGKGTIYILIDGTHRCVRSLREGVPYPVRLLTDKAARACLVTGHEHMPWTHPEWSHPL